VPKTAYTKSRKQIITNKTNYYYKDTYRDIILSVQLHQRYLYFSQQD